MSEETTVSLDELNAVQQQRFVAALGAIYEHSPWVAEAVLPRRPFRSLADLHDRMSAVVTASDASRKLALLNAHPDLAGKAARAGELTEDLQSEQQSAGLDRLSEGELEKFHRLNGAYLAKFGFPFIICVRRHTKDSLFQQFEMRLKNDATTERERALLEVIRIAALRLDRHVSAPDTLNVNGRVSTHILDLYHGRPGSGVAFELKELSAAGDRLVVAGVTNTDGRTDNALIGGRPIPIGRYELRFAVGDYFARLGIVLPDPPFLDVVSLRFSVAEPEGHYHVPLLATPWGYSTYRGS